MRKSKIMRAFNILYEAGILVHAYGYDAITVESYRVKLSPRLINVLRDEGYKDTSTDK